jgi:hypothetical protein
MYYSKINIDPENAVAILSAAQFLQCNELCDLALAEINKLLELLKSHTKLAEQSEEEDHQHYIILQTVINLWKDAVAFGLGEIIDSIQKVLAPNFDLFSDKEVLSFLPYDNFLSFVTDRSLLVENEFKYFNIITNYIDHFSRLSSAELGPSGTSFYLSSNKIPSFFGPGPISEDQSRKLYQTVAFEKMSLEQLETASECTFIPSDVLVNGLLNALKVLKGVPVQTVDRYPKLTSLIHRPIRVRKLRKSMTFNHVHDFDENGVLFYLGTEMSSVLIGSPSNLTSRQQLSTCTRSKDTEWISIDFGANVTIRPQAYTLMHGAKQDKCNLRKWVLEGSLDKQTWVKLHEVKNETKLGGFFGTKTWQVQCDDNYRCFRIRTSNYFIQIAGIEIYGEMKSDYLV